MEKVILEKGDKIEVFNEYNGFGEPKGPRDKELDSFFDEFRYNFIESLRRAKATRYLLDIYGLNNDLDPVDFYELFSNLSSTIKKYYL
jgi:hypothetical protein